MLAEPIDATDAAELLARWGATWKQLGERRGWHVDNVFDASRILRLPGTYNRKADAPRLAMVVEENWHRTYGVDDLDEHTIEPPPPPPEVVQRRSTPYIGPERPGDAFNANPNPTPAQMLRDAGFHSEKVHRNGDREFWAPPRTERETSGARIYADDGHTTIYSETFARQAGIEAKQIGRAHV